MASLPEEIQLLILSGMTPASVVRFSAASREFNNLADSDHVWKGFLPPDIDEIISRSPWNLRWLITKKALCIHLIREPLILREGHLSFALDKNSAKKIYMLGVRNLTIAWEDYRKHWKMIANGNSRFGEVAISQSLWWLEISCKIETKILSPNTVYVAFLVYSLVPGNSYGFMSLPIRVLLSINVERRAVNVMASSVYFRLHPRNRMPIYGKIPQRSYINGRLEVELGEFFVDPDNNRELHIRLFEMQQEVSKSGLIVEGIEFRPKV